MNLEQIWSNVAFFCSRFTPAIFWAKLKYIFWMDNSIQAKLS